MYLKDRSSSLNIIDCEGTTWHVNIYLYLTTRVPTGPRKLLQRFVWKNRQKSPSNMLSRTKMSQVTFVT
jgi:hypothetical protein